MSQSELQAYTPWFQWELKTGELNVQQRRQARAMLFGCFGQKKCFRSIARERTHIS